MPKYPVSLPFAIFAADTEGRVRYRLPLVTYTNLFTPAAAETVWISPQVETLTGYTPTEWIDTPGFFDTILYLVANARDAMPTGGTVSIATSLRAVNGHESTRLGIDPGHYVLTVTDTGVGIDPDTLNRIFDPFFTTKKRNEGTGLGLSTVFSTIRKSGGAIDVASTLGKGTTFRVLLPAVAHPQA